MKVCKRCGVEYYNYSMYDVRNDTHKCNYMFWKRIEEYGECIKG